MTTTNGRVTSLGEAWENPEAWESSPEAWESSPEAWENPEAWESSPEAWENPEADRFLPLIPLAMKAQIGRAHV